VRREWRGPYSRKTAKPPADGSGPIGIRAVAFNEKVVIREDGRCIIFNPVLRDIYLIYEHYKARGETIVVLFGDPKRQEPGFYAVALSPHAVEAKVRIGPEGVHEYGREELDP
jgi:hypothetical protein